MTGTRPRGRKCPDCDGAGDTLVTRPSGPRRRPTGTHGQYAMCLTCGGTGRTATTTRKTPK